MVLRLNSLQAPIRQAGLISKSLVFVREAHIRLRFRERKRASLGFSGFPNRVCARLPLEAKVMFEANNPQRHIHSTLLFWALMVCLAFLAAPSAFAQGTGSATLRGTVKDPKGAVVPNAAIPVRFTVSGAGECTKIAERYCEPTSGP